MEHKSLANKYRPKNFLELKGQDIMVKTITNAIRNNKPFHAYLFTGIRGVGKTTVARLIAKTLNCSDLKVDEKSVLSCEKCNSCVSISEDKHPDVIEFDAASKTGVNDVREIIDSARYVPILSKYKVYIIDEVHMLSNNAFNALLKILEEPPANVIFIFATTEFRKIPMTIISRCQKFDLYRFSNKELVCHLKEVCEKEEIKHNMDGLKQITKYSEGSVRDGLSLLETVSMYKASDAEITEELVREVLGISEVDCKYKLFEVVLNGDLKGTLAIINEAYYKGEDLYHVLEELLYVCNVASKVIAIKGYFEDLELPDSEKNFIKSIAEKTDIINLTTLWQMIFKGVQELKFATNVLNTIEMLMIRICHLSCLPSPKEIIEGSYKKKQSNETSSAGAGRELATFKEAVGLFRKHREMVLYHNLMDDVKLIDYSLGRVELKTDRVLQRDFSTQVAKKLEEWTSMKWQVVIASQSDVPSKSLRDQEEDNLVNKDGLVKEVLESFPGAKIKSVVNINN